ncbi:MAG TPA: hypothetical protein VEW42_02690 [Candidatus Eisenbacteria bacterium]|nr:hypothetical protein [Candidatus Eisenbacteria bacterium]
MKAQERDRRVLAVCRDTVCSAKRYKNGEIDVTACPLRRPTMTRSTRDNEKPVKDLEATPPDQRARQCLNSNPA